MSIIWTLRKFIDSNQYQEEKAAQQRDLKFARWQKLSGKDDDHSTDLCHPQERLFECRVCRYRSSNNAYCPHCLADTMVEIPSGTEQSK